MILVDAADMGRPAGAIERFCPGQVRSDDGCGGLGGHGADVMKVVELAEMVVGCPTVRIVAIQPEQVGWSGSLTATVAERMPALISAVRLEIDSASG